MFSHPKLLYNPNYLQTPQLYKSNTHNNMQGLRIRLQTPQLLYSLLLVNLCSWVFLILPNLYFKGLTNSIVSLKSSPYSLPLSLSLFCSLGSLLCFFMYLLSSYYLGPLLASERQFAISNFFKNSLCCCC